MPMLPYFGNIRNKGEVTMAMFMVKEQIVRTDYKGNDMVCSMEEDTVCFCDDLHKAEFVVNCINNYWYKDKNLPPSTHYYIKQCSTTQDKEK